jgi:exosortase/archaeosortase family protein
LTALTAGYAYFTQPTWLRRAVLFALAVPIAILGNVMRIVTIAIIGLTCSEDFATGFYHDYSGYVVFLVAIALMVAAGGAIDRISAAIRGGKKSNGTSSRCEPMAGEPCRVDVSWRGYTVVVLSLALIVPVMAYQARSAKPIVCEPPEIELGELDGFERTVLEPSEAELKTLPSDTQFVKRLYTAPGGVWFQVTVVIGGVSKSSIHRPELCLPSQGFQMTDPRDASAAGTDWRFISLVRSAAPPLGFAYTFFNQAGFRTPSHMKRIFRDVWDRSVHNRIDRWVMVTINAFTADDSLLVAFLERIAESCSFLK